MRRLATLLTCALLFACESAPDAPGATADAGSTEPDADPGPDTTGEKFTVSFGPLTVEPYGENTQCIEVRVGNVDKKWIGKLHTKLTGVSHHLIVYKVSSAQETPTPFDCTPFLDTLDPSKG